MIGGISAPPELAAASTPAADSGLKPELFISGMVIVPVVAVLATALPESEPIIALLTTETSAGPPGICSNNLLAKLITYAVAPVCSSSVPNSTNRNT